MINRVSSYFLHGHIRTVKAKRNIIASFLIKGISIMIGLILVPLTINYLEPTRYGIWITLSSIIGWFSFFDIGLGNGLRNRFAEAVALGETKLAKTYVSTTYALVTLIMLVFIVLLLIINPNLNWNLLLNVDENLVMKSELSLLALIVFIFFCIRFIFSLITTILRADQRPAKASFIEMLGNIIALFLIYVLTKTSSGSLLYLGIILSFSPVIVLFVASLLLFRSKYGQYRPSLKYVDLSKVKDLLKLGVYFFLIQISAVILYQTNNIIISHLFGPAEVTPYNIAYKYFGVLMMVFSIIVSPFWSAFTEAWTKKDYDWIRRIMKKLIYAWIVLFILSVLMLLSSNWIYAIWIGSKVSISFTLSLLVALWVLLNTWNGIFSQFLNGVGKVRLQMILGLTASVLNIPLAIFLGRKFGVEGVLAANLVVLSVGIFLYPKQYFLIINKKATGIFNR